LIEELFDVALSFFGLSIAMGQYWMRNHRSFRRFEGQHVSLRWQL
jgi:hypothetical protein